MIESWYGGIGHTLLKNMWNFVPFFIKFLDVRVAEKLFYIKNRFNFVNNNIFVQGIISMYVDTVFENK